MSILAKQKGVASLNVRATCNVKEEFTSVDNYFYIRPIWRNSDVSRVMIGNNANALLLGDMGYGILWFQGKT